MDAFDLYTDRRHAFKHWDRKRNKVKQHLLKGKSDRDSTEMARWKTRKAWYTGDISSINAIVFNLWSKCEWIVVDDKTLTTIISEESSIGVALQLGKRIVARYSSWRENDTAPLMTIYMLKETSHLLAQLSHLVFTSLWSGPSLIK